jgi:predicted DNA-binding ribbon-helix-helix protein
MPVGYHAEWYIGTKIPMSHNSTAAAVIVERVQTGVRLEKRMLKVLKALADSLDLTLGDLLEGIVLHAFEGKAPFSKDTRAKVDELRKVFGLALTAANAHQLKEKAGARRSAR